MEPEDRVDAPLGAEHQVAALRAAPGEAEDHPPESDRQGDPKSELPEERHPASSSGAAS